MEFKIALPRVLKDTMAMCLSGHQKKLSPYISKGMWLFFTTYLYDYLLLLNKVLMKESVDRTGITRETVEDEYAKYGFGNLDPDTEDALFRELYNSLDLELGDEYMVGACYDAIVNIVETIFDPNYKKGEIIDSLLSLSEAISEKGIVMIDTELVNDIISRTGKYDSPVTIHGYEADDFTAIPEVFNTDNLSTTDDLLDSWRAFTSNLPDCGSWFLVVDSETYYVEGDDLPSIPKKGANYEIWVVC